MKKCAHCGFENPDDAKQCSSCGKQEFITDNPSQTPADSNVDKEKFFAKNKHLALRIIIAGCIWVIISALSLHVAWQQTNQSIAWEERRMTEMQLESIQQAIRAFKAKFNTNPTNFEQLNEMTKEAHETDWFFENGFYDGWNHPFIFSTKGTNCVAVSYGADGKPGGEGINADLTSEDPRSEESAPTFKQFWSNKHCEDIIHWCFISGGLAAVLSLLTVRIPNLSKQGIVILVFSLGATLFGTFYVTMVITALHVPSGH